jgi:hypothetical protein
MFESWKILKATIPKFAEDMIELGGNRKLRKAVCMEVLIFTLATSHVLMTWE